MVNAHKRNSQDNLHSLDFVEAIKKAREYQPDKDALVIFAGACQSYYELLVASGANFANNLDYFFYVHFFSKHHVL